MKAFAAHRQAEAARLAEAVKLLQHFVRHNSSEEQTTFTVKSDDIRAARAFLASLEKADG